MSGRHHSLRSTSFSTYPFTSRAVALPILPHSPARSNSSSMNTFTLHQSHLQFLSAILVSC
ncbi:hypothetical protein NC652_000695 [Populus alba x Populus x berolinensis]|nr:hypothetical protein NC652_000695 [Populus alba x Populus x berolinensis]